MIIGVLTSVTDLGLDDKNANGGTGKACPRRKTGVIALGLMVLCTLCTGLRAQPATTSPIPSGSGLQFDGGWSCVGAFRNNKTHRAFYTAHLVLDGKWLELTERDLEPATGYVAQYLIGYDPQQARMVEFDANNFGAAIYYSEKGWENGILTMTAPLDGLGKTPRLSDRFVYSITGAGIFQIEWQTKTPAASKWNVSDHLRCIKTIGPGK